MKIEKTITFNVGAMKMVIQLQNEPYWKATVIEGESGTGNMQGGEYKTFEEYEKEVIQQHTYSYNFFNHGYAAAKQYIGK